MTGNFARGTGCCGRHQLRLRLVLADVRRRELGLPPLRGAAANLPGGLPASAARILRGFGAAAPEPGNVHDPGDGGRDDDGRRQAEGQQRDGKTVHKSAVTFEVRRKIAASRKPNSVPRRRPCGLRRDDDHSSSLAIAGEIKRPTRRPSDGPSSRHVAYAPLFGLAPCGVLPATLLPRARCALTAPFHPYSPSPG